MKRIKLIKKILPLLILIIFVNKPAQSQNKLEEIVKPYRDSVKLYGISVLVVQNGKIEEAEIGVSSPGVKLEKNLPFGIGSLTKTFIATIVFKLQEKKLLNIEDHIGKYIDPQNKFIDTSVSLHQLMNHSSGIDEIVNAEFLNKYLMFPRLVLTKRDMLNQLDTIAFPKGTKCDYSNTNYFLLGMIIEKVTDKPLDQVINEELIMPYHLTNTYSKYSKDIHDLTHPLQNGFDLYNMLSYNTLNQQTFGAGQIVSSVEDIYTFFRLLFKEKKIISGESLNQMLDFQKGEGEQYGLGIFRIQLDGKDFIYHTGRVISYGSRAYYVPKDDFFLVTLTNNMDDTFSGKIKTKIFIDYLK